MRKFSVNFWSNFMKYPMFLLLIMLAIIIPGMFISVFAPTVVTIIFFIAVCLFFFITYRLYQSEYVKEEKKRKNWETKDYVQKYQVYVDLVHETAKKINYNFQKLDKEWILTFDNCLRITARLKRTFNNFDISACLIYTFLLCESSMEEMTFIFECVKELMTNPKDYKIDYSLGGDIELKLEKTYESVQINLPDDEISIEALINIFKAYFIPQDNNAVLQLSDFLHILYLRCKMQ